MFFPFITLIKLLALGSLKFIFLLLGIAFFPKFALRLVLNGATGMLVPALAWLVENGRLTPDRHVAILADLEELALIDLTISEARQILRKILKKMFMNLRDSVLNLRVQLTQLIGKLSK